MNTIRWGVFVLTAVAIVAVGTALFLSTMATGIRHEDEWVKALLQAGLIAGFGVVTSSVLEAFKDGLQRIRDQSKIRFGVLADVGRIYMDVKLVRRRAQMAKSIALDDLPELNDRQVRLELHKYNSAPLFKGEKRLQESLEKMEKYLNRVANRPDSAEHREFLDSKGFQTFSSAFHEAMMIMQSDIAGAHRR
jgi:hypothetical protein